MSRPPLAPRSTVRVALGVETEPRRLSTQIVAVPNAAAVRRGEEDHGIAWTIWPEQADFPDR